MLNVNAPFENLLPDPAEMIAVKEAPLGPLARGLTFEWQRARL